MTNEAAVLSNAYGHAVELMNEIGPLYSQKTQQLASMILSFQRAYLHVDGKIFQTAFQSILEELKRDTVQQGNAIISRAIEDLEKLLPDLHDDN